MASDIRLYMFSCKESIKMRCRSNRKARSAKRSPPFAKGAGGLDTPKPDQVENRVGGRDCKRQLEPTPYPLQGGVGSRNARLRASKP